MGELIQPKNYDQLYPGRFMKAGTLDGRKVTVTIASIKLEELDGDKGKEKKAIFAFQGKEMQFVCCKTNALCIRGMFGNALSDWIGKKITLYEGKVESGSMRGQPCIRIWGSPDIQADLPLQIKLPKKKAFDVVMHRTGGGAQAEARPAAPAIDPSEFPTPAQP